LYQVSAYGFWIATLFLVRLTIGFVYEMGKGALKFTDHRSSVTRTPIHAPR
jgi:NADH:ubiquinone oxidoreductase subunit 3 (subunit A)